jgi:uncharacterized protein (TIGR00288 family)
MRPWWLRPPAEDNGQAGEPEEQKTDHDAEDERRSKKADDKPEASPAPEPEAEAPEPAEKGKSDGARKRSQPRKRAARRKTEPPKVEVMEPPKPDVLEHELVLVAQPERSSVNNDESRLAIFCDLENVALGVRDSDIKKFELNLVLERLLEKGKIIVKKAYCDWERYSEFKRTFHEAAVEMIDIPQKYYSGKNSADIKMVVDAMEMCYSKDHVDTFVILSGDSDFSPLVSKLREANKQVIGVGVKNSSSALLVDNCDEFLFYEDIWRESKKAPGVAGVDKKRGEAFNLMIDAIKALMRENKDVLWGSMVKQTMKRKRPSFNEGFSAQAPTSSRAFPAAVDRGALIAGRPGEKIHCSWYVRAHSGNIEGRACLVRIWRSTKRSSSAWPRPCAAFAMPPTPKPSS